jgi:hypothetical protein
MSLYPGNSYYTVDGHFVKTYYVAFMELETYFAREIFKNDLTRIQYAATDFAFRQRLNYLARTEDANTQDYQLPFATYTRNTNWELDTRTGINSAQAYGGTNVGMDIQISEDITIPNCRFMQVTGDYSMTFFFHTDIDMQIAYETLLWIKRLTPKQWSSTALEYGGARVGIPIVLQINSISVDPSHYNEAEWLKQQRIFPIDVQFTIRTMVFDQVAQGTTSTLFKTTEQDAGPTLYIAHSAIFDFMTYKGEDMFLTEENIEMTVTGTFNPDPVASVTLTADGVGDTTATLNWTISLTDAAPGYVATATIILATDPQNPIVVNALDGTYPLTDLKPGSNYSVKVMFETTAHTFIVKYVTFTTTGESNLGIEGIIGLKF